MLSAQIFMNVNSLIIHDLGINITICNTVNSKIFSVITLNSIEYGLLSLNSIKTPSRPSIYDTTIFTCIPKLFVWFVARKLDRIFCLVVINQLVSLFRSFNKTKWFLVHSVSLVVHSNFALNLQSCREICIRAKSVAWQCCIIYTSHPWLGDLGYSSTGSEDGFRRTAERQGSLTLCY